MFHMEIKDEFDNNMLSQCLACLSVDRRLLSIGKYIDVFKKLIEDHLYTNLTSSEDLKLCWECHTQLRKTALFRQQVIKANEMILHGQSYVYGTLSCLTTVVINDKYLHTIYFNEGNSQTNIKTEDTNEFDQNSLNSDLKSIDVISNQVDDEDFDVTNDDAFTNFDDQVTADSEENKAVIFNDEINVKIEVKDNKKTAKTNKWAKKRALLNKRPKFKIVSPNKDGSYFRRIQIDVEALMECTARERDSDRYKASKYKCDSCVRVFKNEKELFKHNTLCHGKEIGTYICDICLIRFPHKSDLTIHVKRHFRIYECSLCGLRCTKKDIKNHVLEKHKKIFQCLKCELKFGCRRNFFKHFKDWHEKFICDHCGISFKMRYCIKDHLRKQHSPFECQQCGKRFARYNGLWLHNKIRHAASPASRHYCVECDKHYPDVYRYRWHLANSAKHKPKRKIRIPCPDCEKVFSKKIYMTDHYNLVHLKQYKYRCEECDKNFIRNADLVKHKRRIHEGILPPKNKICYVCGRGFTTNKILSNHLRTHTGERPFACSACPARFAQRAALRGHMRALHPPTQPK